MGKIENLIKQYRLLSDWYLSVLENISDEDGKKTIGENTNSIEWLAGHLITGRYRNLMRIGVNIEPYKYMDKFINQSAPPPNAIAFSKDIKYPTLTECRAQWEIYTDLFLKGLEKVDEKILNTEMNFRVPTGGNTIEDALNFIVMHESFHIGQISIMRKTLGLPSMQLGLRAK